MPFLPRRARGRSDREEAKVREHRAGDYESAMVAVRHADAELDRRRRRDEPAAVLQALHERIGGELANAAAAATDLYQSLLRDAGGRHHAEVDPDVIVWKRRMNAALTLRSKHQLAQLDDQSSRSTAAAEPLSRAAYGPHQAGLDLDIEPERSNGTTARTLL